ncbi:MAG: hypothetical protein HQK57_04995 [Deltaproteobacteria bacterium]|nr:hypothetical protein [Deltaproteobacteria bacterium]MBF0524589.1 hypothetical protein [Deltaproteobacteria bacterium]
MLERQGDLKEFFQKKVRVAIIKKNQVVRPLSASQQAEAVKLDKEIMKNLEHLGVGE